MSADPTYQNSQTNRFVLPVLRRELGEIWRFRYVVYSFVYTSTKIRYKRSYLGYLWTVFGPMMNYIMIGLIMGLLLKDRMENYYANYFSGALFFSVVSGVLGKAPNIMINNEHYIRKIYVPKAIFLLNVVVYELWNFALSAVGLIVIGFLTNTFSLHPAFPIALLSLLLTGLCLTGLAAIFSVATVYFRDLGHIVPILLQALFFATPVAYSEAMLPPAYRWIVKLNPVTYFLEMFRLPLVNGELPPINHICFVLGFSIAAVIGGFWTLHTFNNRLVFKL